tara:strand:+ start:4169 stop:5065 length:897 start_codon:yes stop_codon:yes gene_type:complete
MTDRENTFPIKCFSISGGGHNGFSSAGIVNETYNKLWDYDSIESIFATSSGSIVGVITALKLDMDNVEEYILNRPIDNLLTFDSRRVLSLVNDNGMYGSEIIREFLKPLFAAADIDLNINLKNFFEHTNIYFNIYTSELNSFESVVLNHETFPELSVIDAVSMSCAIPIIFKPFVFNNKYYFDGGFFKSSPYSDALMKYDSKNIICTCERHHIDKDFKKKKKTSIHNFFMNLLSNSMHHFNLKNAESFVETPTTFIIESESLTPQTLYKCKDPPYRTELYKYGKKVCKEKLDIINDLE